MSKSIVLLIHGMGTHPLDNMTREFKTGLIEAANGFGIKDFDPDESMDITEYNYSETLDNIRKKLAEDAQEILDLFPEGTPGSEVVQKLLAFQANFSEDEFEYTHWLDVALYSLYYGEAIRIELAKKLNNLFKEAGNRRVHVIAHSLGTAVLHDTIDKFYKVLAPGESGGDYPYLRAGGHNLKTLWTFANVSKLVSVLNNVADEGPTLVRSGPTGCTDSLYNIYHTLDPFCWFEPYKKSTVTIENGRHFEIKIVRKKNTHSFQEYVANPEVAKYLLAELVQAVEPLKPDNFAAYVEKHKENTPNDIYEKIEGSIGEIKAGRNELSSIKELFELVKSFVDTVEDIWEDEEDNTEVE
jgi:hypothetical protein